MVADQALTSCQLPLAMALSSVIQYKGDSEGSFRAGEITAREEAEVTLLVCIVGHSSLLFTSPAVMGQNTMYL